MGRKALSSRDFQFASGSANGRPRGLNFRRSRGLILLRPAQTAVNLSELALGFGLKIARWHAKPGDKVVVDHTLRMRAVDHRPEPHLWVARCADLAHEDE